MLSQRGLRPQPKPMGVNSADISAPQKSARLAKKQNVCIALPERLCHAHLTPLAKTPLSLTRYFIKAYDRKPSVFAGSSPEVSCGGIVSGHFLGRLTRHSPLFALTVASQEGLCAQALATQKKPDSPLATHGGVHQVLGTIQQRGPQRQLHF